MNLKLKRIKWVKIYEHYTIDWLLNNDSKFTVTYHGISSDYSFLVRTIYDNKMTKTLNQAKRIAKNDYIKWLKSLKDILDENCVCYFN